MSVDEAGFDSLWVPDHIERTFGDHTLVMYEAGGMLAAIAEATESVSIGASVFNAAWKHPVHLVHSVATLAEISGGRAILGIGSGGRHYEHGFVNAPTDYPFSRFEESVEIVRRLLDGEEVTYDGRFWETAQASIKTVDNHRIPLMIAAQGPKSIDLAFKHADIWNAVDLSGTPNPSQLADRIAAADTAAATHGRAVKRSVDLMLSPVPTPGMDDVPIITGSTGEIIESLATFAEAGFDEVHCYGPSPAEVGGNSWQTIVEAVHTF